MSTTGNPHSKLMMFIDKISEEKISDYFNSKTLHKGKEYYNYGQEIDSWYNATGETLFARIEGSIQY